MTDPTDPTINQPQPSDETDLMSQFEAALADHPEEHYVLRLYVAGATPRSMQALERLQRLCETYLPGRYELEVIDIYQSSVEVLLDNVVAIPTLVKRLPLPIKQMVGDLSNTEKVLKGLGIT